MVNKGFSAIRPHLEVYDLEKFQKRVDLDEPVLDTQLLKQIKEYCIHGIDNLSRIEDSGENKKALIMAHGPSLLSICKKKYKNHMKISCNDFHKIKFFDDFKPDFWLAANSYDALIEPLEICLTNNIDAIVTAPRKDQLIRLIQEAKEIGNLNLFSPWIWNIKTLQGAIARRYGKNLTYSLGNTITVHMIAFAMLLGCRTIDVAGFDMSYKKAIEVTGKSHAGENLSADTDLFEDKREIDQMINDITYLAEIAKIHDITINNLSSEINGMPKVISANQEWIEWLSQTYDMAEFSWLAEEGIVQ